MLWTPERNWTRHLAKRGINHIPRPLAKPNDPRFLAWFCSARNYMHNFYRSRCFRITICNKTCASVTVLGTTSVIVQWLNWNINCTSTRSWSRVFEMASSGWIPGISYCIDRWLSQGLTTKCRGEGVRIAPASLFLLWAFWLNWMRFRKYRNTCSENIEFITTTRLFHVYSHSYQVPSRHPDGFRQWWLRKEKHEPTRDTHLRFESRSL